MNTSIFKTDTTVDVLVVGSGTGMAAALAAEEAGLSVMIVEKTEYVGGSTARSGGAIWVPGNDALKRDGGITARSQVETYLDNVVSGSASRERYISFLDHGPAAVAMLERTTALRFSWIKGYSDYFSNQPGGNEEGSSCEVKPFNLKLLGAERSKLRQSDVKPPLPMPVTGADYKWLNLLLRTPLKSIPIAIRRLAQGLAAKLAGGNLVAGGQALAAGMFESLLRSKVPILVNTKIVELIEKDGRVVGAVVELSGKRLRIMVRHGVVLACGGFDHNMMMRADYQSASLLEDVSLGAPGNVGDGILLGQRIGADLNSMKEAWWFPAVRPVKGYPPILLAERSLPGSFVINDRGKRFTNEAQNYMTFGQKVIDLYQRGEGVGQMWLVFDQKYRNSYMLAGSILPRQELPESWYKFGIAVSADTPEELAKAMGVPEHEFVGEFSDFNQMATSGLDTKFKRGETAYDRYYGDPTQQPNPNLRPLSGRLYAIKLVLSDLGTCGGLTVDGDARVLRHDGTTITGLYAIGNNAANTFGGAYPGSGATIGQGITFGYVAVQHMLNDRAGTE
ncbi:TPA: 3-ketosteroid-delta-1-dehydrogenase [Serratia marcescens]|uniref:3-ketosteroid-delta-1-dehydrogenase n=1 Tax=Serratia nevei TaxID=2703794 RepID=UPI00313E8723